MKDLWKRTFELFRRNFVLWVPCSVAGILMVALSRLEKVEIHWFFGFFGRQRSVFGGVVPSGDLAQVQHRVMMVIFPLGFLKQFLEVFLFVLALAITKVLVEMILEARKPDMVAAVKGLVPKYGELLLFSLKYMAVMAFFGGFLLLASYVLASEHFREIALSKVIVSVYSLLAEGCLAWLLIPSAIRMLWSQGNPMISVQKKQMGTIFAVAASAATFGLEFLVGKAESTLILDKQWEREVITVANTVIVNTPQVLLFIALSLMAMQTLGEGTLLADDPKMNWGRQLSDLVRRAREWGGSSLK